MNAWPSIYRPAFAFSRDLPQLRLFDSYRRQTLAVPTDEPITIYVCGITPYDATHLGHAATYLAFDLAHRYLLATGLDVIFLENVTDIDDPLFERARRDKVDWQALGEDQVRLFVSDMTNLRVLPPVQLQSVTEGMENIIAFVTELVEKGLTYRLGDELYLDAGRVTDFSNLPLPMDEAITTFGERGGDPDRAGKRHPLDPVLWRASAPDEPMWQTSFGSGRPGWHVECNAIAGFLLNQSKRASLTLQGGGADLIFPHHYMTDVQSRARSGEPFAQIFSHAGMIRYQGEKMSKSLGNLVFVSKLIAGGIHPMAIRLALISGHYRQEREWSEDLLFSTQSLLEELLSLLSRERVPEYEELMIAIVDAMADDLDTPRVLTLLKEYLQRASKERSEERNPGDLSRFLDALLGLTL